MRILGLGDCITDIYQNQHTMYPGGNVYNVAVHSKKLGADSSFFGVVGNDSYGDFLLETLDCLKIDRSHCQQKRGETGFTFVRMVDGDRTFYNGNRWGVTRTQPIRLTEKDMDYVNQFDLIHSGCFSFIEPELYKLKRVRGIVSFDISTLFSKEYLEKICPFVDMVTLSAGALSKKELENLILSIHTMGSSVVLATQGAKGATLYSEGKWVSMGAKNISPIDTTGAGDACFAALAMHLIQAGWTKTSIPQKSDVLRQALHKASTYATQNCLSYGSSGKGSPYQPLEIHTKTTQRAKEGN